MVGSFARLIVFLLVLKNNGHTAEEGCPNSSAKGAGSGPRPVLGGCFADMGLGSRASRPGGDPDHSQKAAVKSSQDL
eukprot:6404863-Pyramimonas_sp.AAC.1